MQYGAIVVKVLYFFYEYIVCMGKIYIFYMFFHIFFNRLEILNMIT